MATFVTLEAREIDQATQREAQRFLDALRGFVQRLEHTIIQILSPSEKRNDSQKQPEVASKNEEVELESGDVIVRYGSDPTKNVHDKNRVNLQVYQVVLPEGDIVYLSIDPETNIRQLILPPNKPLEQIPELWSEIEMIAKTGQLRQGTLVNYKPSGRLNYQKIYLAQTEPPSIDSVAQEIAEKITKINSEAVDISAYERELDETVKIIEDNVKKLQEIYVKGIKRHLGAMSQPQKLSEGRNGFSKQFNPSVGTTLAKINRNHGGGWREFARNFRNILKRVKRQCASSKPNCKDVARMARAQQALARALFTLAHKANAPESPGKVHGIIYALKTYGPGYFALEDANGNQLMSVRQENLLSPPQIVSNLTFEEVNLITAQVEHINKVLGDRGIDEYLSDTTPKQMLRDFGNLTPIEVVREIVNDASFKDVSNDVNDVSNDVNKQPKQAESSTVYNPIEALISAQTQVTSEPSKQKGDYEQEV